MRVWFPALIGEHTQSGDAAPETLVLMLLPSGRRASVRSAYPDRLHGRSVAAPPVVRAPPFCCFL